jgi:hypothetical protein
LIVKVKIVSTRSVATFWSISPFQLQFRFWMELAFLLVVRRNRQEVWGWIFARLRKVIWEGVVLADKEVAVVGVFRGLGVVARCSVLLAKILRTSVGVQFLCWVAMQSFKSHLGMDL